MSSRRKGRELALMALYAIDGVPSFEVYKALNQFWRLYDDPSIWEALFAKKRKRPHPMQEPHLWEAFDVLTLEPIEIAAPPEGKPAEAHAFALVRVEGFIEHSTVIDKAISASARGWRLQRMAQVDRNILRLGAYELLFCEDIPHAVAISEAIELSKRYSNAKSRSFINGVLDRIHKSRKEYV
ncbi:MAG TPA: transcription antitermination factor NusB [Myxococcales bacterium]|nr:transcription antitermination factor NusB [Deltaproteobacteria bacterium]MBU54359.1 transcription antitermination factor NusB [Deltaproteobacteria bacterium]HAA57948.1 transcription antitermination factor NusB [Myxococcales bacterium]|tara:strand:- start:2825 stop:3373 length:549 start_codon:yes stop_codon:yes gene_type:complete